MKRELVITKDGSHSIYLPEMDEHYHSIHGSMIESEHIFIRSGLIEKSLVMKSISILEIGMGTGLNVLKTALTAKAGNLKINYHGVEAFPLTWDEVKKLNYVDLLESVDAKVVFEKLHQSEWNNYFELSPEIKMKKSDQSWQKISDLGQYDLVYFDAFAPEKQSDMWTEAVFQKVNDCMNEDGILVSYCVKGEVRRLLKKVGFRVEKLKGPEGGKREILRAWKE